MSRLLRMHQKAGGGAAEAGGAGGLAWGRDAGTAGAIGGWGRSGALGGSRGHTLIYLVTAHVERGCRCRCLLRFFFLAWSETKGGDVGVLERQRCWSEHARDQGGFFLSAA
jgi:hypothetical protein